MNETESISAVAEYLTTLGYPMDSLISQFRVEDSSRMELIVKVQDKVLIIADVMDSAFDVNAILKAELFDSSKIVSALQKASKSLAAEYYILSNGIKHLWFTTNKLGRPILTTEVPFSAFRSNIPLPIEAIEVSFKELFAAFNHNFYIAGGLWENDNEFQHFVPYSAWQPDVESKYLTIIESVVRGDLIIFKSNKYDTNPTVMSIRGMGRVLNNDFANRQLEISWQRHIIQVVIKGIIDSHELFSKISKDDIFRLFENIGIESIRNSGILEPLSSDSRNSASNTATASVTPILTSRLPGLLSDSEKGVDYLDITKDVNAFARVIAAKGFEPPLAIAVFGKWGSGKSFFMQKLKDQIVTFSDKSANGTYCKGIVHIHFNAWSYMDANLWASFVSKIFEGLQEYIKNDNNASKQLKNNIKEELSKQLHVTKAGIDVLQEKKATVERQLEQLQQKRTKIKREVDRNIQHLKTNTVWGILNEVDKQFDAKSKIVEELQGNSTYVQAAQELRQIIPEKYWNDPKGAYAQVRSTYTFLKEFFRREKVISNLFFLGGILLLIFLTPLILEVLRVRISKTSFLVPQAGLSFLVMLGAIWRRGEVVYKKLQPIAASFWKVKEDYEELHQEAVAKFEQEEKALKLEIQKGEAEVILFTEQIQKAQAVSAELDYKISNALATETLYSFIEERSKSEDYKKHLGIISIIRKDFEILNGLFVDHKTELVNQQQAEKFRKYFHKPVERIILYIDDLDRCPEDNVVQVLEAVNLLMAFPLFVVVVGVDPRWVKNALIKKHILQFAGQINKEDQGRSDFEVIEPSNYLEKIFQIPFHLKDAKRDDVKRMIRGLAFPKEELNDISVHSGDESDAIAGLIRVIDENTPIEESLTRINEDVQSHNPSNESEAVEALRLSERDVELMADMSDIIGSNPRAIKRFVNIFRIIKVHDEFSYDLSNEERELLVVLFLIALSLGKFKKLVPSFEHFLNDGKNLTKTLYDYLQPNKILEDENLKVLRHKLNLSLSDKKNYESLQFATVNSLYRHNDFIKRFTFKNL